METSDIKPENNIFLFTAEEFISLQNANIATAAVSLISSVFVVLVYVYMLLYHGKKANRVSLRCVFMCSISEALSSILSIITTTDKLRYCNAANIILGFTSIFSAAALTIVGLNLFLIFVVNVRRKDILEKIYYPVLVVYSVIGALGPVYQNVERRSLQYDEYTCWYVTYGRGLSYNNFPYIWYYSFIFAVNIVAVILSAIALVKLLREKRRMNKNAIATNSMYATQSKVQQPNHPLKRGNPFAKVVLRCIIYPLVPFISDIFGFIMEIIYHGFQKTPSFTLSMFDVVFSKIEGFLVAMVFFSDPAVTSMISELYTNCYQKYVVEYTTMAKEELENSDRDEFQSHIPTSSGAKIGELDRNLDTSLRETSLSTDDEREKIQYHQSSSKKKKLVAMRRISISGVSKDSDSGGEKTSRVMCSSCSSSEAPKSIPTNTETTEVSTIVHSLNNGIIYIPYKYPLMATFIHRIMHCLGCRKPAFVNRKDSESTQCDRIESIALTVISANEDGSTFNEHSSVPKVVESNTLITKC